MSELIDSVEISRGRPQKYPWETWTDGQARRLHRGTDFDATLESFQTMVHRKRRELGYKTVHTKLNLADESIQVQFIRK